MHTAPLDPMAPTDDPATIVRALQTAWANAFATKDWPTLAALYVDHPAFYGSTPDLHTTRGAVQSYFEGLPPSLSQARYAEPHVTPLGPDCIAASGPVTFINQAPHGEAPLPFRMTQVLVRSGQTWRIAVHHASARPGPLIPT